MAKTKKVVVRPKQKKVAIPRSIRTGLDRQAALYAELLADPCNGPLVSGPFGDGGGGIVSRFELDAIVNSTALETGAAFAFIPSLAYGYQTSTNILLDSTAFTFAATSTLSPGLTYLAANASSFRCLSACLQVTWPGTEFDRSGIVGVGQTPAGYISSATLTTTSQIRTSVQYVERTPVDSAEIVWRPNNYDLEWSAPNVSNVGNDSKASALVFSQAGSVTAGIGMRVRVVAVYEWMPKVAGNNGLVQPANRMAASSNTFQDVIKHLDSFGDWMYHGALNAGKAASSVLRGIRQVGYLANGVRKVAPLLLG